MTPGSLQFAVNPYGRPHIVGEASRQIDFNLSHTEGCIVLAIAPIGMIGVDVEKYERARAATEVAERFFTRSEFKSLFEVPPETMHHRFCEIWTLKEAYIKARGMGLSLPLDGFSIGFPEEAGLSITFDETVNDDPSCWRLWTIDLSREHALALAVRSKDPWRIRLFNCRPLAGTCEVECRVMRSV